MSTADLAVRVGRWPYVALLILALTGIPSGHAAAIAVPQVLQVPYIAQSELLCGGAAVAMVERWWGRRGVYAEEFASLVHRDAGGIFTNDLLRATEARGWQVRALEGTPLLVQQSLRDSIPVIALIKAGHDRFHYVVIIGWDDHHVTYHDPAIAPFVKMKASTFLQRWRGANSWMMVMEPQPPQASATSSLPQRASAIAIDSMPCRPWLDQAADAATINQLDRADQLLAAAASVCPTEPVVLRELAGIRFRQGRQPDAIRLVTEYLRRVPTDTLGWQLLASSRYLCLELGGALDAWNVVGRPAIDLVRIDGIQHVRYLPLAQAMNLMPRTVLTSAALALAQRRLADVPALVAARVSYAPVAGGIVEVRAAVAERPVIAPVVPLLVNGILRAAIRQDVQLAIDTPFGAGEEWTAQWRWENADPRQAISLSMPTRIVIPGVVNVSGDHAQFRFSGVAPDEVHQGTALASSNWISRNVETRTAVGYERWGDHDNYVHLSAGTGVHLADDRVMLAVQGASAVATTHGSSYFLLNTRATWMSTAGAASITWSARIGFDWASASTPLGARPMAGGDLGRDIPLRAHQFIVNDRLPAERIGQGVAHGGGAADRPFAAIGPIVLGGGLFVDAAQVIMPGDRSPGSTWYLDGGAGLRIGLGDGGSGAFRIDLARGLLTDPRWGLTVGYEQAWPPRLHGAH